MGRPRNPSPACPTQVGAAILARMGPTGRWADEARRVGISTGVFVKWARGERRPGPDSVPGLARWLGLSSAGVRAMVEADRATVMDRRRQTERSGGRPPTSP